MKNIFIKTLFFFVMLATITLTTQGCSSKKVKPSSYSLEQSVVKPQCNV
jgi:hypothetical protein